MYVESLYDLAALPVSVFYKSDPQASQLSARLAALPTGAVNESFRLHGLCFLHMAALCVREDVTALDSADFQEGLKFILERLPR